MNILSILVSIIILISSLSSSTERLTKHDANTDNELQSLNNEAPNLKYTVLKLALHAFQKADHDGSVHRNILTVIDYSLPSNKKRLWIFDLNQDKLLYKTFVAHGKNSGLVTPHHFSNKESSKESSLGTFVTKDTYYGSKGLSLNLQGLEHGLNDHAYSRRIVIHGAWYVEPSFIHKAGRAGLSWGCPAVAASISKTVIKMIKGGSVLFAYSPDQYFLTHSDYIAA